MSDRTIHASDSSRPPRPFRPLRIKWIFLCSVVFLVGYFSTQHRFQDPFLFERKFYAEVGLPCAPSTCDKRDVLTSLSHLSTQEIQCLISLPEPLDIINHTSFLVRQNAKRFKFVADAMLKLADSENRFNISNHLSLLSQTSRDLAVSARSVFFAGKDTLETSETTFTKLRSTIDGVQNGASRLVEVIKSRAILVDSHQSRIWRWTTELDKAKAQVSEVSRVKEEMLADSTPSSSRTSNIDTSGDIERTWLDLIFPASIRGTFGSWFDTSDKVFMDEVDEWWAPYISKPLPAEVKERLKEDTTNMLQVWEALGDLESELIILQHRLGKCQQMFEMAQMRTQKFQNSLSLIEVLKLYDDGLDSLKG